MSKRDTILTCAEKLILRDGSGGLTLDRIALEAKVSKGGLLYHFPTKEELVSSLVARTIEYFDRDKAHYKAMLGDGPGTSSLAYALASLNGPWAREVGLMTHGLEFIASILASFAMNPKLIIPLQEASRRWQKELDEDGIDPTVAAIIRLAVDGLWFNENFGLSDFSTERREEIIAGLKRLCLPGAAETAGRSTIHSEGKIAS